MNKSFLINLTPYNHDLLVSVNQSEKEFKTLLEQYNIEYNKEDWEGTYNARTIRFNNGAQVIKFEKLKINPWGQSNIAHEAFHVVEFLFEKIGLKHSLDSSEAYAYMIGYIVGEINYRLKCSITNK